MYSSQENREAAGSRRNGRISIIVPAYNEEGNMEPLADRIAEVLEGRDYQLIFVDDGSRDGTLRRAGELHEKDDRINYISFSRNFGHHNALKAGLDYADGDCVICMDGDLQHPPELIPEMIRRWEEGYDIVNTLRQDSKDTGFLKKLTARCFYRFINAVSRVKISHGSADFRLMDSSVVKVLRGMPEYAPFYRGLIPWVGFRQGSIDYEPNKRFSGETKYSFRRMVSFAMNGILSFSVVPLRIATILGLLMAATGFIIGIKAMIEYFFTDNTVQGWTSIVVLVVLVGGVQLVILGIIGEYLGRLFMESKGRPHYIVRDTSLKDGE